MNFMKTNLLAIAMLLSVVAVNADETNGGRSVYFNVAKNGTAVSNLGWNGAIYQHDKDDFYACFKLQMEYGQNTKADETAKYFSNSGSDSFVVGPKNTGGTTATTTDISGMNFLFNDTFKSTVTLKPKMQDFVADFGMYVGLDEWLEGLYFTSHLPLQHSKWKIGLTETVSVAATALLDNHTRPTGAGTPYANVEAALKGDVVNGNSTVWSYGKHNENQSETRIGDATMTLGYNIMHKEHMHLGLGVTGLLGGGKKTTAEYIFTPAIGYNGRYGVGGTADFGVRLWDKDENNQLVVNGNVSVLHLFANEQRRSYDLTLSGDMSRYLLVKKFGTTTAHVHANTVGNIDNMINIGSLKAKIGMDVVYNGNLTFCWQMNNMSLDFGY